jgi:hypothetical protein
MTLKPYLATLGVTLTLGMFSSSPVQAAGLILPPSIPQSSTSGVPDVTSVNFGSPSNATFGQTFNTGPTDVVLQSFTFSLNNVFSSNSADTTIGYRGYVAEWSDANKSIVGSVLYTSGNQFLDSGTGFSNVSFAPDIQLSSTKKYVLFISTSPFQQLNQAQAGITTLAFNKDPNVYPDGQFVYANNLNSLSSLSNANSFIVPTSGADFGDLALQVRLLPVPFEFSPALGVVVLGALFLGRKAYKTFKAA